MIKQKSKSKRSPVVLVALVFWACQNGAVPGSVGSTLGSRVRALVIGLVLVLGLL